MCLAPQMFLGFVVLCRFFFLFAQEGEVMTGSQGIHKRASNGQFAPNPLSLPRPGRSLSSMSAKVSRPRSSSRAEVVSVRGFVLSGHVLRQAESKGFSVDDVMLAVDDPQTSYASGRFEGQTRYIRGQIVAVVQDDSRTVVTCYLNVVETDLRSDQRDADAQRYGRERGSRR